MVSQRVHRWTTWGFVLPLTVILAAAGYWMLFTTFMVYDDEGYVLISLRNYAVHGALYDQVYTQYGPFPYVLYDALSRLFGFDFTNTSGRWITLVNWLGAALACSALVGRITRSSIWAAATLAGTFLYLWIMTNEPVHPGGLIVLIVGFATWFAAEAWRAKRHILYGIICGLAGAVLALTKINVGVFFVAAAATWLALNSAPERRARLLTWVAAIVCAALPLALMRSLLDAQWVGVFALVFATGALSTIIVSRQVATLVDTTKTWITFAITLVGSALVVCAVPLLRGTTLHGLLDGVVLQPLKHPGVYFFPMRWQAGSGVIAIASLGSALIAAHPRFTRSDALREGIGWLRVIVAGVFWCTSLGIASTSMSHWGLCYGVSLAWLFVLPLRSSGESSPLRAWVALMLVFQSLQAYPVAGSQLSWGTYLWIALMALGIHDAAPLLTQRFDRRARLAGRFGYTVVVATALFMAGNLARIGWNRYFNSQPLGLAGAEDIRVPNDLTYALRISTENLREHADVLFTFPGMYSTNLWTGLRTPTLANATHWFSLLSPERQQAIVDDLAGSPRAAIFVQQELIDYLARHGFPSQGLLANWLRSNFEKALSLGAYEIWIHRGRMIAPLSTAKVNRNSAGAIESLTLTLRSPGAEINRIELCDIDSPRSPIVTIDGPALARIQPCGIDGTDNGTASTAAFPFTLSGLAHVTVPFTALDKIPAWARPILVLRDPKDAVIGELIMVQ